MLHTLKCGSTSLTDGGLHSIIKGCPNLNHLEVSKCEITDQGLKYFIKELPQLKFLDIIGASGISQSLIMEIQAKKPDLKLRKYRSDKVDPKDNGLRVPRRVVEKEGGKKKKKK